MGDAEKYERESTTWFFDGALFSFSFFLFLFVLLVMLFGSLTALGLLSVQHNNYSVWFILALLFPVKLKQHIPIPL